MPTYTLHNKETGETYEEIMTISAYEDLLAENPHIVRVWENSKLNIVSGVGGIKVDDGFKEVLTRIKKGSPGSTIDIP